MAKRDKHALAIGSLSEGLRDLGVEPEEKAQPKHERTTRLSARVTREQAQEFADIAGALEISRHQLLVFALSYFLSEYKAGNIAVEFETVRRPKMP